MRGNYFFKALAFLFVSKFGHAQCIPTITIDKTVACLGESVKLNCTNYGDSVLVWNVGGYSTNQQSTQVLFFTAGNYTAVCNITIASPPCTGTASIMFTILPCSTTVGIQELFNFGLQIYPNPNTGAFTVDLGDYVENSKIILANGLGQKVFEQTLEEGLNTINCQFLEKGLYYSSILKNERVIVTKKIIIE